MSSGAGTVNEDVVDDVRVSANGSHVVFATAERLVAADTDSAVDVYERAGGVTTLVSAAPGTGNGPHDACTRFQGCPGLAVSADGARVVFETADPLVAADTDGAVDVYERAGGVVRLLSEGGSGGAPAFLDSVSADGARVIFSTAERLVPADTDGAVDVYERAGATTTLVSRGAQNENGAAPAAAEGVSTDGSRVVFSTAAALVPEDSDAAPDLYARAAGVTELVSGGTANVGSHVPRHVERTAGGCSAAPRSGWSPADTDTRVDVYAAGVSSGVPPVEEPPVEEPPVEEPPVGATARRSRGTGGAVQRAVPPPAAAGRAATGDPCARVRCFRRASAKATPCAAGGSEGAVQRGTRMSRAHRARGGVALHGPRQARGEALHRWQAGRAVAVRVKLSRAACGMLTRGGACA